MATHVVQVAPRLCLQVLRRLAVARPIIRRQFSDAAEDVQENHQQQQQQQRVPEDMYHGISLQSFSSKLISVLMAPVNENNIEIKPDGLIYLPEIMYRRILNEAFGPGGWALMPRGDTLHYQNETESAQLITREYALYCQGRFVSQAVGEHTFYSKSNLQYGKACESAKSNALMRCCKDLGIASELWDPKFISKWKEENAVDIWCENVRTREKKRLWRKKSNTESFGYPWKETKK